MDLTTLEGHQVLAEVRGCGLTFTNLQSESVRYESVTAVESGGLRLDDAHQVASFLVGFFFVNGLLFLVNMLVATALQGKLEGFKLLHF